MKKLKIWINTGLISWLFTLGAGLKYDCVLSKIELPFLIIHFSNETKDHLLFRKNFFEKIFPLNLTGI
ncbi:hypothetical protein BpHYR1_036828 [Brachionus plicatilis]|uniref:Uncharacterized protein n=1 Tax=Brachionus plicatilis TaxID=10195 RepID=A0A3M7RGU8_BRAPC|nr:hypothetical protein BpHYR1_036828 [Brachionus plicatilis]